MSDPQTVAEIAAATPRCDAGLYAMKTDSGIIQVVSASVAQPIERENRRLRSALSGLVDLIGSFEEVSMTRDLPLHEAEAIYDSEVANAKLVLQEIP